MTTELTLVHYSDQRVERVHSVEQVETPFFKPRGLWLSVDSCEHNWRDWCEGETFQLHRLALAHDVTLTPTANILRLSNAAEIDAFDQAFSAPLKTATGYVSDYHSIPWAEVAKKYQGIIIAPYIWERRLSMDGAQWYYAWDCASGCIWDAAAIASITRRPPATEPVKTESEG